MARPCLREVAATVVAVTLVLASRTPIVAAQTSEPPSVLRLSEARARARASSPELAAAREAVAAAEGTALQARALPNPTFAYGREQTQRGSRENEQDVLLLQQPVEIGGQRRLRSEAAAQRRLAAESRLTAAEIELDLEVTGEYAAAVAADANLELATAAARAFDEARTSSRRRRTEGDVSGYEDRRIALEAARYAARRAEAESIRETARAVLAARLSPEDDPSKLREVRLDAARSPTPPAPLALESLQKLALDRRPDLAAVVCEQSALEAEAALMAREAIPTPTLGAGYKTERAAGDSDRFEGYVVELSVTLPVWDRRVGSTDAARAEARRAKLELQRLRRDIRLQVEGAWRALQAIEQRLAILQPQLDANGDVILRASRSAYDEGELSLVEWLDAVRAHYELRGELVGLASEALVRRAALERAIGGPLP